MILRKAFFTVHFDYCLNNTLQCKKHDCSELFNLNNIRILGKSIFEKKSTEFSAALLDPVYLVKIQMLNWGEVCTLVHIEECRG
ncbi:hypothetical protein STEG23_025824 [Scotinomys teguina]